MTLTNKGSSYIIVPQSTLDFGDGTKDYVTIPANSYMSPGNNKDLSVSCWFNPTQWSATAGNTWCNIVGKGPAVKWGLNITTHASPRYDFHVSSGGNNKCHSSTDTLVELNKWTHLVGTYDGSNQIMKLYIDGEYKVSSLSKSGSTADTTTDVKIGWNTNNSISGQVYDVRFWSGCCLTADDAKKVYNGIDVQTSNLVAHYKFLEREDTTLEDSQNNLDGTITGADWYERKMRCWNSRWDEENYNITVETFIDACDRNFLFRNVIPGAYTEQYNILGTPKYIDLTYTSSNTLVYEPISGYGISSLRQKRTVAVKNISDSFINRDTFKIKIESTRLDIE